MARKLMDLEQRFGGRGVISGYIGRARSNVHATYDSVKDESIIDAGLGLWSRAGRNFRATLRSIFHR